MNIIKIRSFNAVRAQLFGYKLTPVDKLILLRSPLHTHTELQFSDKYRELSFSSTNADGCKCCRFKHINYTHPERWDTIEIKCDNIREEQMFYKAMEMADVNDGWNFAEKIIHGPNAIKYDLPGVAMSFILKWHLWKPDKVKVWCTEAVATAMGIKDLSLCIRGLRVDDLHPTLFDTLMRPVERML